MNVRAYIFFHNNISGPFCKWEIDLIFTKNKFILIYFNKKWISYKCFKQANKKRYYVNKYPCNQPFFFHRFIIIFKRSIIKYLNMRHIL